MIREGHQSPDIITAGILRENNFQSDGISRLINAAGDNLFSPASSKIRTAKIESIAQVTTHNASTVLTDAGFERFPRKLTCYFSTSDK